MIDLTDEQKAAKVAIRLRGVDPKCCALIMDVVGDAGSVTLTLNCSIEFRYGIGDKAGATVLFKNGAIGELKARTGNVFYIQAMSSDDNLKEAAIPGEDVVIFADQFRLFG